MGYVRSGGAFGAGAAAALFAGWIGFPALLYERVEQPLPFDHAAHKEAGLACEDCHKLGADGRFSGVPATRLCADCHDAPKDTEAGRRLAGYVAGGGEIPWLVYARQPDNAYFSHAPHLKLANLKCERCHGPHGTTSALRPFERNRVSGYSRDIWGRRISGVRGEEWEGMKMSDCVRCHGERCIVQSCLDCHK